MRRGWAEFLGITYDTENPFESWNDKEDFPMEEKKNLELVVIKKRFHHAPLILFSWVAPRNGNWAAGSRRI